MHERQKYENGSQISSTSNFNKALAFALPGGALNSKGSGTNSVTIANVARGGTNHNKHRGGITQNNFDKCNPVCNDEDDLDDDAVYEMEEFETVDHVAHNYGVGHQPGAQEGQTRGQSGAPGTNNSQNMGNNTFYAGQNTKFFDKRILASQK